MKPLLTPPLILAGVVGALALAVGCAPTEPPPPPAPRGEVEATASVDKAVATTGDLITFTITVDHDRSIEVELPDVGEAIAGFRIIDFGQDPPLREGERRILKRWYTLRGDLVGSYILPAVTLPYGVEGSGKEVATSEIFVEVQSVLPTDGSAKDIRGLKPLRRVHPAPKWPLYGGAFLLLILAGLGAAFLWRRAKRRASLLPEVPAHEVAFEALGHLRSTDFSNPGAVRRYYFAISEVVRTYIEGRFDFNATDLTTEELLPRVGSLLPSLSPAIVGSLSGFFVDTDTVKFAGHTPTPTEIEAIYEAALSFVESTLPQPTLDEEPAL